MEYNVKLSYPPVHLLSAVVAIRKLSESTINSSADKFSREDAFQILSYSPTSGRGSNIFSSLGHFNLIERADQNSYTISSLGKQIVAPTNSLVRAEAKFKAFTAPSLYKTLFNRFGPVLLLSELARGMMEKEYGIATSQVEDVLEMYNKSLNYLITGSLDFQEVPAASTLRKAPVGDLFTSTASTVKIQFGTGIIIEVPKKLIYKVVTDEMSKH